jgi:DNA adenine methylase
MNKNTKSPLRYPGGKNKIFPFVELVIKKANINNCVYIEPFAGGAGIALNLLLSKQVEQIVINDYDRAIYSFWRAVLKETNRFIDHIYSTPVTIDEWHRQQTIYMNSKSYTFEYGFATFFLNRTNHSGILSAGPIGGKEQAGEWKLDVRYNKDMLVNRIQDIAKYKKNIKLYCKDVIKFIDLLLPRYEKNGFIYFDPPYYQKGKALYKNYFEHKHHIQIADSIFKNAKAAWIVSYDNTPEIETIYKDRFFKKFNLNYSLANNGKGTEIMVFKNQSLCPTVEEIEQSGINITLW